MNTKYTIGIAILCLLFMGCNDKKAQREQIKKSLSQKYNAITANKELDGYIYRLQDKLASTQPLLCYSGWMEEVSHDDTSGIVHIQLSKSTDDKYYVAILHISIHLFSKLKNEIENTKNSQVGAFVFSVSKIEDGYTRTTEGDSENESHDVDIPTVRFKGQLIDFILYNKN